MMAGANLIISGANRMAGEGLKLYLYLPTALTTPESVGVKEPPA